MNLAGFLNTDSYAIIFGQTDILLFYGRGPLQLYLFKYYLDFLVVQKKLFDQKDKVNFKFYDVTTWLTNNYNTYIAQYPTVKIGQLNKHDQRDIFLQKSCRK